MMSSYLTRLLYEKRWFTLGWSLAFGAMVFLVVLFFPSIRDSDFTQLTANVPEQMKGLIGDVDSFRLLPNYLAAQLYDIRVPLFMMILSLVLALSLSVGLEEKGALRTSLTSTLSRGRLMLETWLAGLTIIAIVSLAVASLTYLGVQLIGEPSPHELIWRLTLLSWLYGAAAFSLPLAVGLASGSRSWTLSIGLIVTVGGFILSTFAVSVDWLQDIEVASLLHYYDTAALLAGGFNSTDLMTLSGLSLASMLLAYLLFARRDLQG